MVGTVVVVTTIGIFVASTIILETTIGSADVMILTGFVVGTGDSVTGMAVVGTNVVGCMVDGDLVVIRVVGAIVGDVVVTVGGRGTFGKL
jgi:hypothetical protein